MKRRLLLLTLSALLALGLFGPGTVWADSHDSIQGTVVNGTPEAEMPVGLEVVLTVFDGETTVDQRTTTADLDGRFGFTGVPLGPGLRYVAGAQYQGAAYQVEVFPGAGAPASLIVYESTQDQGVLTVLDDTIMVTRGEEEFGELLLRQVVRVRNEAQRTFTPSFDGGSMGGMTFLRLSLPVGYQGLTVRSDLLGGQVIPIDRGIGITSPVPPGLHAIVLSYLVPYRDTNLVLEPLYPFGAEVVRVLLREDIGRAIGSDLEEEMPITVSGNEFKVYQLSEVAAGDRITIGLTGLPRAPWSERAWSAIKSRWGLTMVIPGLTAVFLVGLLAYAWRSSGQRPAALEASALIRHIEGRPDQRQLVEAMAKLDEARALNTIPEEEYQVRRRQMMQGLLRQALREARPG